MQRLREAVALNDLFKVEQILKEKLDLSNSGNETILHYACSVQNILPEILRALIFAGSDVVLKNYNQEIPLHILCKNKPTPEALIMMITLGSNPNEPDSSNQTSLHKACTSLVSLESFQVLIEGSADPRIVDNNLNSPLHFACLHGADVQVIKLLIENGAKINSKNKEGYTPLHNAVISGKIEIVNYLIEQGANVYSKNNVGFRALHIGIQKQVDSAIIYALVVAGCPLESSNKQNEHALIYACTQNCSLDTLRILYLTTEDEKIRTKALNSLHNVSKRTQIKQYSPLGQDLYELFTDQAYTDIDIDCSNGTTRSHSLILKARIGEKKLEKTLSVLKKYTLIIVKEFMKYIYSGVLDPLYLSSLIQITKEIGTTLPSSDYQQNLSNFSKDFAKLYSDNSTKDFQIIVEKNKVLVHKLILFARSDYFDQIEENSNENSNENLNENSNENSNENNNNNNSNNNNQISIKSNSFQDITQKSYKIIQQFVKGLYFDKVDQTLNYLQLKQLQEVSQLYLINPNSFPLHFAKKERSIIKKMKNADKFVWKELITTIIFLLFIFILLRWLFNKFFKKI